MRTNEVSNEMVGKKVEVVFTGLKVTGVITGIVEDEYSKGVAVKLDKPVQWGDDMYTNMESTARKKDEAGNLQYTKLI